MITFAVEIGNNGSCWKPKIYDTAQVLAQPFPVYIDIRPQGVSDEGSGKTLKGIGESTLCVGIA